MFTEDEDVGLDEFDLDLAWGDLDPQGGLELYLPTGREIPGETCDTQMGVCRAATAGDVCPHVCQHLSRDLSGHLREHV